MKAKRVECDNCQNFKQVGILQYRCKLGKRVMFRMPTNIHMDNGGFIRYCNDFKQM